MDLQKKYFPEISFGKFTRADGTFAFYGRVNAILQPEMVLLDCGCGRGEASSRPQSFTRDLKIFKGKCAKVIGIDVDAEASKNQIVDEFRLIEAPKYTWPVESASVDMIVSDYVLEHVDDPVYFFSEAARVLKPGGYFCLRTVNVISYFGMISSLAQGSLRSLVLRRFQENREEEDVFPVRYRCNTKKRIQTAFQNAGFDGCVLRHETDPGYGKNNRFVYFMMEMHRRYAPRFFKLQLYGFGQLKK